MACCHSSRNGLRQGCAGKRERKSRLSVLCGVAGRMNHGCAAVQREKILSGALGILAPVCR